LLLFAVLPGRSRAGNDPHLIINEVFYYVDSGKGCQTEWIELYNPTGKKIPLAGYKIGDEETKGKGEGMYSFPQGTEILSGEFIIIVSSAEDFEKSFQFAPDFELKDTSDNVKTLSKYSAWSNGSMNLANSGDEVLLLNGSDQIVDGVSYSKGELTGMISHPGVKEKGQSLERQPKGQDSDNCARDFIVQTGPSPGLGLFTSPEITGITGMENKLKIDWKWPEIDRNHFDRLEVYLAKGTDFPQTPDRIYPAPLPSSPLILTGLSWATEYRVRIAIIKKYGNRELTGWSDIKSASTEYDLSDEILISELYPAPSKGRPEFIELFNNGNRPVNLKGWYLADLTKEYRITSELLIQPKEYLALYNTGLTLNNTGDTIRLRYPDHSLVNKTSYSSAKKGESWSRKGQNFYWTPFITANKKNRFPKNLILEPIKIKKVLKQKEKTMVITKGQVSAPPPVFGKQMIYIQDQTAGIQLYFYRHQWPKLKLGTWVRVTGEISSVRGEKRIKIKEKEGIRRIKEGQLEAKIIGWEELSKNIGRLITISGTVSSSSGSTFYLAQGNTELRIYIKDSTRIDKPVTRKGYRATVTGVLVKNDQGFKLLPRYQQDLKISEISQIADYGRIVGKGNGSVKGQTAGQGGKYFQQTSPEDFRLGSYQSDQAGDSASPHQPAGLVTALAGGITLAGFLTYLYRFPFLEILFKIKS